MNYGPWEPDPVPRRSARLVSGPDPNGIDLRLLAGGILRNKWIILLCVLLAGGVAMAMLRTVRPSYVSYTEVLLNTRQERVFGVEQVVSDLDVTNSVIAGEIAVLRSNLLLGRVVDKLNLVEHPDFNPFIKPEASRIERLIDAARERASSMWGASPHPQPDSQADDASLSPEEARNLVIWRVRQSLTAQQSGISYVIGISVQAHDPDVAAAIANAVAEQYLQDQLDVKLAATQRAIQWLDTRLVELEGQLRAAEDAVVDFLAEMALAGGGDEESVAQQLAELNRTVVAARSDRAVAEARLGYVQQTIRESGAEAAAAVLTSPRLQDLDAEQAEVERQIALISGRLGPRHPDMLALRSTLADLDRDRQAAVDAAVGELEATLAQAAGREREIEDTIAAAHLRQVELSRASVRLRQLERSASAMRQVYESFLARFQETTQQTELQRPDAQIITRAEPALAPSRPRKQLTLAVALVLGGLLGLAVALVREVMNRTVRSAAELGRVTDLPVLGVLPTVRRLDRRPGWQRAALGRRRMSAYAEGLRVLRAGLLNHRQSAAPRVVMITAAEPGVGCSTTVLGLARVVAAVGQRVVIVDANFRRPSQHLLLDLQGRGPGVAGYVAGHASVEDATVTDAENGVSVVPIWRPQADGADILSSTRFQKLVAELSERFDLVLIDAAPSVGFADAKIVAGLADAVVLVARSSRSREESLVAAIAALEQAGAAIAGAVLSWADRADRWTATPRGSERMLEVVR